MILPGALYVTESALRGNTGTHYTPRELAEEVVLHALEPLVFVPGPLQTADRAQWTPESSEQILDLKVADIAMGSAAFLVAASRYLGARLVDGGFDAVVGNPPFLGGKKISGASGSAYREYLVDSIARGGRSSIGCWSSTTSDTPRR